MVGWVTSPFFSFLFLLARHMYFHVMTLSSLQVLVSLLKSYQLGRLKVVVDRRPTVNTAAARCQARERSLIHNLANSDCLMCYFALLFVLP